MTATAASGAPPELDGTVESGSWRDKAFILGCFLLLLCFFYRPLFVHDVREIIWPTPLEGSDPPASPPAWKAWANLGADLVHFAIIAVSLCLIALGRIGSIAFNTFREAVRNRILYFILFFALILMGVSGIVKELAMAAHDRIVIDLGLSSISFFGLLAAVFVGISLVYNELERKTIYTIVSKPVHRHQFLLGKFFGLLLTIYVIVAIMALFFFVVLNYQALTTDDLLLQALREADEAGETNMRWVQARFILAAGAKAVGIGFANVLGFASGATSVNLLIVVALTCLELMIVTAFAILFSSFTTPTLSAVFTILIFLAGRLNEDIIRLAIRIQQRAFEESAVTRLGDLPFLAQLKICLVRAVSVLVPNLDSLNVTADAVHKEVIHVWRYPVLYALCYTGTVLMLAIVIFRKRNFK